MPFTFHLVVFPRNHVVGVVKPEGFGDGIPERFEPTLQVIAVQESPPKRDEANADSHAILAVTACLWLTVQCLPRMTFSLGTCHGTHTKQVRVEPAAAFRDWSVAGVIGHNSWRTHAVGYSLGGSNWVLPLAMSTSFTRSS